MSKAHVNRLYDISAYISAARAVASEVFEQIPGPNKALLDIQANHLASLTDAVQFLLDRAGELAGELERDMDATP